MWGNGTSYSGYTDKTEEVSKEHFPSLKQFMTSVHCKFTEAVYPEKLISYLYLCFAVYDDRMKNFRI